MNKKNLHRIISIWIAITTLLPMSIQFTHALEDHSHDICEDNNIQHFHKHQIECDFDHYFFKTNAATFNEIVQKDNSIHFADSPAYDTKTFFDTSKLTLKTRGPPLSII